MIRPDVALTERLRVGRPPSETYKGPEPPGRLGKRDVKPLHECRECYQEKPPHAFPSLLADTCRQCLDELATPRPRSRPCPSSS